MGIQLCLSNQEVQLPLLPLSLMGYTGVSKRSFKNMFAVNHQCIDTSRISSSSLRCSRASFSARFRCSFSTFSYFFQYSSISLVKRRARGNVSLQFFCAWMAARRTSRMHWWASYMRVNMKRLLTSMLENGPNGHNDDKIYSGGKVWKWTMSICGVIALLIGSLAWK